MLKDQGDLARDLDAAIVYIVYPIPFGALASQYESSDNFHAFVAKISEFQDTSLLSFKSFSKCKAGVKFPTSLVQYIVNFSLVKQEQRSRVQK